MGSDDIEKQRGHLNPLSENTFNLSKLLEVVKQCTTNSVQWQMTARVDIGSVKQRKLKILISVTTCYLAEKLRKLLSEKDR